LFGRERRHAGDQLAGCRIGHVHRLARAGLDPLAVDEALVAQKSRIFQGQHVCLAKKEKEGSRVQRLRDGSRVETIQGSASLGNARAKASTISSMSSKVIGVEKQTRPFDAMITPSSNRRRASAATFFAPSALASTVERKSESLALFRWIRRSEPRPVTCASMPSSSKTVAILASKRSPSASRWAKASGVRASIAAMPAIIDIGLALKVPPCCTFGAPFVGS